MTKTFAIYCFLFVFLILEGLGDSRRHLRKSNPNNIKHSQSVCLGSYSESFFAQNQIRRHLFGVYFYACFWHCFWGASGTNFVIFGVILRSILWLFCVFVGDAATLQRCNTYDVKTLFLRVLGRPLHIIFSNFSKFFFVFPIVGFTR